MVKDKLESSRKGQCNFRLFHFYRAKKEIEGRRNSVCKDLGYIIYTNINVTSRFESF